MAQIQPFEWFPQQDVTPQSLAATQSVRDALLASANNNPKTMWEGIQSASAKIGGSLLNQKVVGDYTRAQKDYADKFAGMGDNPSLSDIEAMASNPFANQGQSSIVQALLAQKFQLQSPDAIAQRALTASEIAKNQAETGMFSAGGKITGPLQAMSDGTFIAPTEYGGSKHFAADGSPLGAAPSSPVPPAGPTDPLTTPPADAATPVDPVAPSHILSPAEVEQKKAISSGLATDIISNRKDAMAANDLQQYIQEGRQLINQPSITGAGAEWKIAATKWASSLGIPVPQDAANNSDAFKAVMGQAVGQIIKQFGSGTGLSDADRQYAQNIAGGNVELNKDAINRILDIAERNAQSRIDQYTQQLKAYQSGDINQMMGLPTPTGALPVSAAEPPVIAVNPKTGERVQYVNGAWVPAQ